ncbi:MAG: hypothetical protein P4L65_05350 [Legionella sp.]|nr:hypothetical protein [Legionella sp.]
MPLSSTNRTKQQWIEELSFWGLTINLKKSKYSIAIAKTALDEDDFLRLAKCLVRNEPQFDGVNYYLTTNYKDWFTSADVTSVKKLTSASELIQLHCQEEHALMYRSLIENIFVPIQKSFNSFYQQYHDLSKSIENNDSNQDNFKTHNQLKLIQQLIGAAQSLFNQLKSTEDIDVASNNHSAIEELFTRLKDLLQTNKVVVVPLLQPFEHYLQKAAHQFRIINIKTPPAHHKRLAAAYNLTPKRSHFVSENNEALDELKHLFTEAQELMHHLKLKEVSEHDMELQRLSGICEEINHLLKRLMSPSYELKPFNQNDMPNVPTIDLSEQSPSPSSKENLSLSDGKKPSGAERGEPSKNELICALYDELIIIITNNKKHLKQEFPNFGLRFGKIINSKIDVPTQFHYIIQLATDTISDKESSTKKCCHFFSKVKEITPEYLLLQAIADINLNEISQNSNEEFLKQCNSRGCSEVLRSRSG